MGLFYANMTVYRPLRRSLLAALRRLRRTAFVSPTRYGHTVVFDQAIDEQDPAAIERLGRAITELVGCTALTAMLHDDDVLYLWLFQKGRIRDRYDSLPSYFDMHGRCSESPKGGKSKFLCKAFDRPEHVERVQRLLRLNLLADEPTDVPGELERHQALAAELGMPPFVAGLGYSAIAGGYVPRQFQDLKFEAVHQARPASGEAGGADRDAAD